MSGDATFSGTNYQASVIAFVFVHVLTETKLRWLQSADDTPSAVSGEVRGPGDDASVEFRSGAAPIEIQTKHGLKPQKCVEAFEAIREGSLPGDTTLVMLIVDSTSSPSVRNDLWRDLDRLRSGRTDSLKELTHDVIAALGNQPTEITQRVHIRTVDVETHGDSEAVRAIELLTENLDEASQAAAAWAILEKDAARMCADKSRRTRKALLDVLAAVGISVRPPRQSRKWHDDLRYSKKLLADDEPAQALSLLREIESDFTKSGVRDAQVLYRLNQHRASALLQLGKYKEALDSAHRALDHDPEGVHALVNLANAQAFNDDVNAARVTAERATTRHPQAASAWLMRFQLPLEPGQSPISVPPDIAATSEYRTGLVQVYLFHGEATLAREVSASLIQEGDRSALVLMLRVDALFADIDTAPAEERLARAQEVERLCSEMLDDEACLSAQRSQRALVGRSLARRILGKIAESQDDSERAHAIRPDDPRALNEAVQAKIQAGDEDAALELLIGPVVEENPVLRAMRASLLAGRRQVDKARGDLDAVLQAIPGFHQPDTLRSAAAEAALHLGDLALAKRLVAEMSSVEQRPSVHHMVTVARIAALEGDFDKAEEQYRQAAAIDPAHRVDLLIEFGATLLRAKQAEPALRVLREVLPLPPPAEQMFVRALVQTDHLAEAHAALERLADNGPMPDWAVAYAAQIALRRNDPKSAAVYLEDLFARGVTTPDGRLTLAKTLLDLDEHDRAMFHARELVSEKELTPRERMFLAQLLSRLDDAITAIQVGLQAYRDAPHDAELNRAFSSIVLLSKSAPVESDRVGADTHVLLRGDDGSVLEYLMFADNAALKLPKEISLDEAQRAGLLGLHFGDVFIQNKGAWFEKRWQVERIQSAVKYLVGDILGNYGARFPSESFFVKGFHFDAVQPSIGDLQPMITSTHERERHQEKLLNLYRDQCLPLAPIATLAGVSTPVLISELSQRESERPFYVEWSDSAGRLASREAARLDAATVLTRSALFTAQAFELLPLLLRERRCIAPRSLRSEIRAELSEAEEHVKEGWRVIAASERGFALKELEAGHPTVVSRRDSIRAMLDWADANVTFLARPLETFSDPRMRGPEMRSSLGEGSNDALELALFTPATLYADDLGLRRLSTGLGLASFSTVSLIQVLAEVGVLAAAERDRLLVSLAERHYSVIDVSPEILVEALTPGRLLQTTREVFSLLVAPSMDIPTAARTLVRAVKMSALQAVKTTSAEQIMRHGLEAMSRRFPPATIIQMISRVAVTELALLPNELRIVKTACVQFLKGRIQST